MFKGTRRRGVAAIAAVLGLGIGSAVWAASAASASSAAPVIRECTSGQVAVWVSVDEGQGAAGSFYFPLEFTNISSRACYLVGYPGVSATGSGGGQLGSAAGRDATVPSKIVTVAPGGTAHAVLRVADVLNFPTSVCKPATASQLKVFPPDQKTARHAFFDLLVCGKKGPIYLDVQRIQPGV